MIILESSVLEKNWSPLIALKTKVLLVLPLECCLCTEIYSIWIYLNKCYLFVIHALMEGVFVFYLFRVDRNTIWIHLRQTRGDGRGKRDYPTAQSYTLTSYGSPRHLARAFITLTASIAASTDRSKGGVGGTPSEYVIVQAHIRAVTLKYEYI